MIVASCMFAVMPPTDRIHLCDACNTNHPESPTHGYGRENPCVINIKR